MAKISDKRGLCSKDAKLVSSVPEDDAQIVIFNHHARQNRRPRSPASSSVAAQLTLTCCKPVADLERDGVATSHHHRKEQDFWQWRVERILRRIERVLDEDEDYPPADEQPAAEDAAMYGWVEPSEVELPSKPFGQAIRDLLPKTAEDEPDFTDDWYSALLANSMIWTWTGLNQRRT
ncbi:hypothetical protein Bbelb_391000 [Branchiostoma belcheri]|nr:hypothetical protein Bbelb_391000 [Branchiostoma belcheri]